MSTEYKRVILVTGSNTGIGYAIVKNLASKGHTVYLASRNEAAGKEAQQKLKAENGLNAKFVQLDITDIKSVQAAKDIIEKEEGRLDVLVHNAGISRMDTNQKASTVDVAVMHQVFETNFFGLVQTTTTFLPLLRKAAELKPGYTAICINTIDMASNSLQAGPKGFLRDTTAYNTSKAAVNSYAISLAHELKTEGIKVNCVTPGFTTTKLNGFTAGGKTPEQAADLMVNWCLLGPEDERKTCLFWSDSGEFPW
ncbi:NAD(P)-binding protein [Dendrothele bispora CBS 962.96]|uniref:NAD(P)-binding protein n=1 Tax=Dendrothele bispora (strain CBS 962.96) TaxID=1314807 RepID=A0A4S8MDH8_DENBC|nr:NAD(P)-binding protein [Dendrothele bispora CBS 962.96]